MVEDSVDVLDGGGVGDGVVVGLGVHVVKGGTDEVQLAGEGKDCGDEVAEAGEDGVGQGEEGDGEDDAEAGDGGGGGHVRDSS